MTEVSGAVETCVWCNGPGKWHVAYSSSHLGIIWATLCDECMDTEKREKEHRGDGGSR